ncbi:hypothetical protein AA313_de0201589 [Arthrobotrys entomopaga]|nr:hypothetical protein AA313_de0201589 [Arthrobotrys entomopaga]
MVTLSVSAPPTLPPSKGIKREASTLDDNVPMTSVDDRPAKKVRFTDEDLSKDLRKKIILAALEDQNKTNGNSALFSELRKKFTTRPSDPAAPDTPELCQTIECLTLVVGQLELHCAPLIGDIIRTNWAARTKILGSIFEKMMALDVEIQTNSLNLDEDEGETLDQQLDIAPDSTTAQNSSDSGIGDEEEDDESDSDSDDDEEEDTESGEPRTIEKMQEIVNKLDAMLNLIFVYYSKRLPKEIVTNPSREALEATRPSKEERETFELLLHFFDNIILPTKSQHVQFILFWASQKSIDFSDLFLGMLTERALCAESSDAKKSAAAYVASFVGRAQILERKATRTVIKYFCDWLQKYVIDREWECSGPDVQKFSGFYIIFQAVMYIFCFKWRDLEGKSESMSEEDRMESEIRTWAPGLEAINRLVTSKFNPLKVCSPAVVNQFAEVANHLGLVYCYTIIERNRHGQLFNSSATVSNSGRPEATQLKAYFPFDPFRLPLTRHWIDPLYKKWEAVPGADRQGKEDEDSENDDSDDDSDEDDDEVKEEEEISEQSEDDDEGSESDTSETEDSEED